MRCYNGCPDSELSAYWASQQKARDSLPQGARCTYFPMEQKYAVFYDNIMVGDFSDTVEAACSKALPLLPSL